MHPINSRTLVVIGGGAAGFFCAVNAARMQPALRVILLEKSGKLLAKVKVSGGGRCNVTHSCFELVEMSKRYPRGSNFLKKSFHHFFTTDTIAWFKERGVLLKTEDDGRMFPVSNTSQTIIDCLLSEAATHNVSVRLHTGVERITHNAERSLSEAEGSEAEGFTIHTKEETIAADYVCVATGGYPKDSMFEWLRETGHHIVPPVPSLFTFNMPGHPITKLMGVAVQQASVKIAGTKLQQEGPVLITHWGLSGPCILKLSAWAARELAGADWKFRIFINWLPGSNEQVLREQLQKIRFEKAAQPIHHKNPFQLPQRFWEFILLQSGIPATMRWADLPAKEQNLLIKNLSAFEAAVQGKTTFKEEFVTAGGIELTAIDSNTMMSRKVPGLYFAGEVLDVDGITGGYNFQNAWTTGYIAAKAICQLSE